MSIKDKITKGPWAWQKFGNYRMLVAQWGLRNIIIGSLVKREDMPVETYLAMNVDGILRPIDPTYPDAAAIATVPEMIDIIERLANYEGGQYMEYSMKQFVDEAKTLMNRLNESIS